MRNCYSYYRVSTDEQAKEGQSIPTQRALCSRWAQENGYKIIEEFVDGGKSATSLNRPALKELLTRCQEKNGVEAVLVQDTDRLARNTFDHLTIKYTLRKAGIRVISISQPMIDDSPEGTFIDTVLAGANALQSQITGRKTSKVMENKAKQGWWPGWAPLGYVNTSNPNPTSSLDRRIVVPYDKTAPFIRKAFQLYSTGNFSLETLGSELFGMGLRTKSSKKTSTGLLANILKNPFYYGKLPWKGNIGQGNHEPLTDKSTFDVCQEVMVRHNQFAGRQRKHNLLLNGYLFCDLCGRRFWGSLHKKRYYLYFCKHCGAGTYIDASDMERRIEKWFGKIQVTPEYATEVIETAKQIVVEFRSTTEEDRQRLQNRKSSFERQMREAENNLLDQTLGKDQFRRIYDRLETDLNSINDQLATVDQDYSQNIKGIERLMGLAENIGSTYASADKELKRMYLGLFFKQFYIRDGKVKKAVPSDQLQPLLGEKVQVRDNWLPGLDSNQRP